MDKYTVIKHVPDAATAHDAIRMVAPGREVRVRSYIPVPLVEAERLATQVVSTLHKYGPFEAIPVAAEPNGSDKVVREGWVVCGAASF